jgi:DNA-binding LacI/PurR family transcriptional regulator
MKPFSRLPSGKAFLNFSKSVDFRWNLLYTGCKRFQKTLTSYYMCPHKKSPTIHDVAQKAGVSIATVSRVLNRSTSVIPATAQRVEEAIWELNYVPRSAARVLASRKTNTIGLLLPEIGGYFFQPMLRGVEIGASEAGYDLLIHTTHNPHTRRPLAEHNTDGLLIFTDSVDEIELLRLSTIGFPAVLLHQTPPAGIQLPVVTVENQKGAFELVEHLIQVHNRLRIVFLKGPEEHEDSMWREKGYREALNKYSLACDPALLIYGGFNRDTARQSLEQLLSNGIDFDAVFAGDDDSAIGALIGLRQAGRRVPEDIAVAGFDDQAFASSLIPPLTTVRAPTEDVGRQAIWQLVRVIQGEEVESRLTLPTRLVIRESCGCSHVDENYEQT